MSQAAIEQLLDRWMNDSSWREALRANPAQALKSQEMDLDPSDLEMLRTIDWSLSDGELEERLSKC